MTKHSLRISACGLAICVGFLAQFAWGQATKDNPLIGTWQRISARIDGQESQGPDARVYLVLSNDGYFSMSDIRKGRTQPSKPLDQMTKEELLELVRGVSARFGTYVVEGNLLTRKDVTNTNPTMEGRGGTQSFTLSGDLLILKQVKTDNPALQQGNFEATFRRVK